MDELLHGEDNRSLLSGPSLATPTTSGITTPQRPPPDLHRDLHLEAPPNMDDSLHGGDSRSLMSGPTLATPTSSGVTTPQQPQPPQPDLHLQLHLGALHAMEIKAAVDPAALITTECIAVTSAMRKHARWAHSSVSAILGGGVSGTRGSNGGLSVPDSPGPRRRDWSQDLFSSRQTSTDAGTTRWGLRGKKGKSMQDNPLISAFAQLRSDLSYCTDIRSFDVPALLHPFLQVIRSSSTSAPITSLALTAITKFFAYNIISRESPRLALGMRLLSSAITHCRFEASDTAADEIVLLRILRLMEMMISGPAGDTLGDESVCEMMETGLSMCCQGRLSELLRRSAEMAMIAMCQVIFERLKHLETEEDTDSQTQTVQSPVKMEPSTGTLTPDAPTETGPSSDPNEEKKISLEATNDKEPTTQSIDQDENLIKPYSLPSIRELFRVVVELANPHDRQHSDNMRVMALRIADVALETAGSAIIDHASLSHLASDRLCCYLFQLVRSENMAVLQASLRVAGTLLETCRRALKLQQELFLSYLIACLHPKVDIPQEPGIDPALYQGIPSIPKLVRAPSQSTSGRSTPVPVKDRTKLGMEGGSRKPDAREAMVESIGALVRIPTFMVELFLNYDCEVDRGNLCEDIVGLLSRYAFPDAATWSTTNVPPLCLDALLRYVESIADRLDHQAPNENREILRKQRVLKKIIVRGALKFNENPKAGILYLASEGIIDNADDPRSVARFLKGTTRISKRVLGEYISKKSHEEILGAFLDQFDFVGKRVDEALRDLLETFRLPGESALIERIISSFVEKYCGDSPPDNVAGEDAVYVLSYAIIMLNTDLHNPNIKSQNRMSYEAFCKNLRGVNGGKDFAPEYLRGIYDSIKEHEIILPDEHDNKQAFDYAWKELLMKADSTPELTTSNDNTFDADMFAATWKPIIATLSYVFMSATDDAVFSRVVTGFDQCARIAAKYDLHDVLDHIIFVLGIMTTLASDDTPNTSLNTEVQVGEQRVMVSELAVKFGRDFKAQLATVVLFRVAIGNEAAIRQGWKTLTRVWLNLFVNSLMPAHFSSNDNGLDIPRIPLQSPSQVIDRGQKPNETGLLSAFTSYLSSYAADDPPEPSDEELESALCTVDCINACFSSELFADLMKLSVEALYPLVHQLLAQLPAKNSPVVIAVKPDIPSSSAVNGQRRVTRGVVYEPTTVFVLELATLLALQNDHTVVTLGPAVADALQSVVRDAINIHPITVSRAIYYLLALLKASQEHAYLRVPVVLHALSSLDPSVLDKCASLMLKGISKCIAAPGPLRNEMVNSPDFWAILKTLHSDIESESVFNIMEALTADDFSAVTADNYEAAVSLLNDFASAGSVGSILEQKQDMLARRGKSPKQPLSQDNEAVKRGVTALRLIYELSGRVQALIQQSHLESHEAWSAYWSPIFRALTTQCTNPCREIRYQAMSYLQRSLLSPQLSSTDHKEWIAIFGEVLFPLILRLLKPEVYQSDQLGMSQSRVQAATLLCKVFLHYLVVLSEWEGMLDLWLKILDLMDRLMNSGQGDNLEEAVPESLKNIILVMADGGYLVPPEQDPEHQKLWTETWSRLDRFLPGLYEEIYPDENKPAVATAAAASPPDPPPPSEAAIAPNTT
ncbi:MAG: hypothetical protein M1823_001947 [Watsoniomyces obsoletus]|nr:MAG: hypothetical protein M1823_001947 [Watsoniomyces obsoletus]